MNRNKYIFNTPGCLPPQQQGGAALAIGLILLVVMTFLGLSVSGVSVMGAKMARNNYEQKLAFQIAEAGLRDAEKWLWSQTGAPQTTAFDPVNRIFQASTATDFTEQDFIDFVTTEGADYGIDTNSKMLDVDIAGAAPTFTIIEMEIALGDGRKIDGRDSLNIGPGAGDRKTYYHITAQHGGKKGITQKVVQSVFAKR